LDEGSERKVLDLVERMRGHSTILLVTHKKEATKVADLILDLTAFASKAN